MSHALASKCAHACMVHGVGLEGLQAMHRVPICAAMHAIVLAGSMAHANAIDQEIRLEASLQIQHPHELQLSFGGHGHGNCKGH